MQLPSLVTEAISSDSHSTLEFCSKPLDSTQLTAKRNLDWQQMEFPFHVLTIFVVKAPCRNHTLTCCKEDLFLIRDKHASGAILQLFLIVGSQSHS